ncbi:hypothetical protein J4439_00285 [Candidatus Woesearchaeota archaeon]|nr:hypothetical protein [Candidatus Woesearchaeota archaeon]
MTFSDFLKSGSVRKSSRDVQLARSLLTTAHEDLAFLDTVPLDEKAARKMMSNYYDTLRAIVEAMAVLDGYKVYSHEAFTFYLKEKGESLAAEKYDRFRRIRNRINYYGQNISVAEVAEHAEGIQKLIRTLTEAYLKDL